MTSGPLVKACCLSPCAKCEGYCAALALAFREAGKKDAAVLFESHGRKL